jgi:hypothetical protein
VAVEVFWFSNLIRTLNSDYSIYNSIIKQLILLAGNPLKAKLSQVLIEEKRLSLKILNQEKIIRLWLSQAPILKEQADSELMELATIRHESAFLRREGCDTLRSGMMQLEKERLRSRGKISIKSHKKEAAPRLIDITL